MIRLADRPAALASRVIITRPVVGLVMMQVCVASGASDSEILEFCNEKNPSGTALGWAEVVRQATSTKPGPVRCDKDVSRTHFIVVC